MFEKRLLDLLGYGIDLLREARSGEPIEPGRQYHFTPSEGLRVLDAAAGATRENGLAGSSLLELHAGTLADSRSLDDARRLLHAALAPLLEGRELATRAVARSVSSRRRSRRPSGYQ
jgi:recombinational DNA repair protein (RecF pathway)